MFDISEKLIEDVAGMMPVGVSVTIEDRAVVAAHEGIKYILGHTLEVVEMSAGLAQKMFANDGADNIDGILKVVEFSATLFGLMEKEKKAVTSP